MNRQTYNAPALRTGPLETGLALTGAWEAPVAVLRGTHTRPMDYVELQPRSWEGSDASCLVLSADVGPLSAVKKGCGQLAQGWAWSQELG